MVLAVRFLFVPFVAMRIFSPALTVRLENFPELIKELLAEQARFREDGYLPGTYLRARKCCFILYSTYPGQAADMYRELVELFPWLRIHRLMILYTGIIAEEQRAVEVRAWLDGAAVIACATVGFGLVRAPCSLPLLMLQIPGIEQKGRQICAYRRAASPCVRSASADGTRWPR